MTDYYNLMVRLEGNTAGKLSHHVFISVILT